MRTRWCGMVFVMDKDAPWVGEDAVGEAHGGAV